MLPALLAVAGGGLLTATLNVAGLRVGATPAEIVLWGAAGVLFARTFALGPLVLAVPVLLAGIELATGAAAAGPAQAGDPLTLALPGDRSLELTVLVFAAAYAAWAQRFGLRWLATSAALVAVLVASAVAEGALPAVTLLGVALLLPNADRLGRLLREGS